MLDKLTGGYSSLIVAALVVLALGAYGLWADHSGYARASTEWQAKYSQLQAGYAAAALAEGTRQANANKEAKQRETERIAIIEAQSTALQDLQRKLNDEQDNDPTSSVDCINDAGRVRLNQIR